MHTFWKANINWFANFAVMWFLYHKSHCLNYCLTIDKHLLIKYLLVMVEKKTVFVKQEKNVVLINYVINNLHRRWKPNKNLSNCALSKEKLPKGHQIAIWEMTSKAQTGKLSFFFFLPFVTPKKIIVCGLGQRHVKKFMEIHVNYRYLVSWVGRLLSRLKKSGQKKQRKAKARK